MRQLQPASDGSSASRMASVAGSSPRAQAADQIRRWREPARVAHQHRQHLLADRLELLRGAEEVGLLDGDQRDQALPLPRELVGRQRPHVVGDGEPPRLRPPLGHVLEEAEAGGWNGVARRLADQDDELLDGGDLGLDHGRTRLRPAALAS